METTAKTPTHLWVVGILGLLFNAGGASNYVMMKLEVASYRAQLTDEMIAYYDGYPLLMDIVWPLSVWSAVVGCLLLLMKKRHAVTAFMVATIAYVVASGWTFGVARPPETIMTTGSTIFSVVIGVQLALLWYYARAMTAKGVLR